MAMSVQISDGRSQFVTRKIAEGRFKSENDVVDAGLELLEAQELKFERLRAAIDEGDASGLPEAFDMEQFIAGRFRPVTWSGCAFHLGRRVTPQASGTTPRRPSDLIRPLPICA